LVKLIAGALHSIAKLNIRDWELFDENSVADLSDTPLALFCWRSNCLRGVAPMPDCTQGAGSTNSKAVGPMSENRRLCLVPGPNRV
jgi:hypothetical protein